MEKLTCQSCGSDLDVDSMDANYAIISCSHCGGGYDASGLQHADQPARNNPPKNALPPAKPANIKIKRTGNKVVYSTRRHSVGASILRVVFFTAWVLIASHLLLTKFLARDGWLGTHPSEYSYLHWLVILVVVWIAAAQLLNSTTVSVSKQILRISHGPVPWGLAKTVPAKSIKQLFVASSVTQQKGNGKASYLLRAVDDQHKIIAIPARFETVREALFLEYDIERELGLIDRVQEGAIT